MAFGVTQLVRQEVQQAMTSIVERLKALEDEHHIRALADSFADICLSGNAQQFEALWIEFYESLPIVKINNFSNKHTI